MKKTTIIFVLLLFIIIFKLISCKNELFIDINEQEINLEITEIEISTPTILIGQDFSIIFSILNKSSFDLGSISTINSIEIYQSADTKLDWEDNLIGYNRETNYSKSTILSKNEIQVNVDIEGSTIFDINNYLKCGQFYFIIKLNYLETSIEKSIPIEVKSSFGDGLGAVKLYLRFGDYAADLYIDNQFVITFYNRTFEDYIYDCNFNEFGTVKEINDMPGRYDYQLNCHISNEIIDFHFDIFEGYCIPVIIEGCYSYK